MSKLIMFSFDIAVFMLTFVQGRAWSRAKSRRNLDYMDVLRVLEEKGISIRVASPKLVMEEVSGSENIFKPVTCIMLTS